MICSGVMDSGVGSAEENMDVDRRLLRILSKDSEPLLRFYEWQRPSISYGYFLSPESHLAMEKLKAHEVDVVRRPTGGGILFHGADFTYSLFLPSGHPQYSPNTTTSYAYVHQIIVRVISRFCEASDQVALFPQDRGEEGSIPYFCMAAPVKHDVVLNGKKVGGGAQRRTKAGLLHQGVIALTRPSQDWLHEVCLDGKAVAHGFEMYAGSLLKEASFDDLKSARRVLRQLLQEEVKAND